MRLLLGLVAVAAAVWLGLSFVSKQHELEATKLARAGGRLSTPAIDRGLREARLARALQPDAAPKLAEARLLYRRGRAGQARVMLRAITRAEPANAEGWFLLTFMSRDPREVAVAARHLLALRPR
jgi:hypothetical protein